jgi:hypothetical protein
VGGCAGDSVNLAKTYLLFDGEVLSDALVVAALRSEGGFGIGVHHGLRPVGDPLMVTQSADGRVAKLGDEPALDMYLRRLGAPPEAYVDPEAFSRFALAHPLSLIRRSGQEIRFISGVDFADRAIFCLADVPEGGLIWFTENDGESVLDAAGTACTTALEALHGQPALGLLAFDCIARRTALGDGDGLHREVQRMSEHCRNVPMAGFYTNGEIARVRGINGFHNHTVVTLAVG